MVSGLGSKDYRLESRPRSLRLCPWARHFISITSLHPGVQIGTCEVVTCIYSVVPDCGCTCGKLPGENVLMRHTSVCRE